MHHRRYATSLLLLVFTVPGIAQCVAYFDHATAQHVVTFTNTSWASNAYYYWHFGDGSTSYEEHPVHSYPESGTYLVTLHVRDTVDQCHAYHQQWVEVTRFMEDECEPYMTYELVTTGSSPYLTIQDGSVNCNDTQKLVDAVGSLNASLNNGITIGNWHVSGLFLARIRYLSTDSILGTRARRAYFRTFPYAHDPGLMYDICSADFEYHITYEPFGAVVDLKIAGSTNADTVWVTGFGNPIPIVGSTSSFTVPYTGGASAIFGHPRSFWRRNHDPAYGCTGRMSHSLLILNPYYVPPATCLISQQPEPRTGLADGSVQFIIVSDPGSTKQWQQNAGLGWMDLFDAGPFTGVHTDTLTISNRRPGGATTCIAAW